MYIKEDKNQYLFMSYDKEEGCFGFADRMYESLCAFSEVSESKFVEVSGMGIPHLTTYMLWLVSV